ncbi:SRPBCC family protein [Falsiroseomonas oryziterrae]|uniref:SRPBCC family protein n=1 Tax=Falsiroseomonas oryziterrae TaxID=2911368 RepID=UPI001F3EE56D|nr:SRPBCC family protein [Roseomonas sp. NPKOSM-4]
MLCPFDAARDLLFTRLVPVPARALWRGWTEPALLTQWFCPKPWRTTEAEVDLRPGGIFRTVMEGPSGERFDNAGCWLEVVPQSRLVFTDALGPGFRPTGKPFFTGTLTFEETPEGTRYTAWVQHKDAGDRDRHAAMGFEEGWGKALDQLVALVGD